jgi:conjugal transfer mating pair stabilization protein TraG
MADLGLNLGGKGGAGKGWRRVAGLSGKLLGQIAARIQGNSQLSDGCQKKHTDKLISSMKMEIFFQRYR